MDRYPDDVNDWDYELVEELCEQNKEEDVFLEYKKRLKGVDKDDLEKEFVAFANARGGHIVFGVSDNKKIVGIENPEDEELAQYVKELLTGTNPPIDFHVGDLIQIADSDYAILVVRIEESDNKPVATKKASYYRRMGESKHPIDRETLMTRFVERDRRQQNLRLLQIEVDRFRKAYDERIEGAPSESEPPFHAVDTDGIREVIRANNHLYVDEDNQRWVQRIFRHLRKIEEAEHRYKTSPEERNENNPARKSGENLNIQYNRSLKDHSEQLKHYLEKLDPRDLDE